MSISQVHAAIRVRFNSVWTARTPIHWPNTPFDTPSATEILGEAWCRISITATGAQWASFGDPGNNTERTSGVVTVQIFTEAGTGTNESLTLAEVAVAAFRNYEDTVSGTRFLVPPSVRQIGVDGKWYQTNVVSPFIADDYT